MRVEADIIVNCAGLHAQEVAGSFQGLPKQFVPERHFARGCYFTLQGTQQAPAAVSSMMRYGVLFICLIAGVQLIVAVQSTLALLILLA